MVEVSVDAGAAASVKQRIPRTSFEERPTAGAGVLERGADCNGRPVSFADRCSTLTQCQSRGAVRPLWCSCSRSTLDQIHRRVSSALQRKDADGVKTFETSMHSRLNLCESNTVPEGASAFDFRVCTAPKADPRTGMFERRVHLSPNGIDTRQNQGRGGCFRNRRKQIERLCESRDASFRATLCSRETRLD